MSKAWCSFSKAEIYSGYFTKQANFLARSLYLEAIDADPNFGRPYAELAYAILQAYLYNWYDDASKDPKKEMMCWAKKALEKDDDTNSRWIMANVQLYCEDFSGARDGYFSLGNESLNAPQLDADKWAYLVDYADMLLLTGSAPEAIEIVNGVFKVCPVPEKWFHWVLAWAYYVDEKYEASLEALSNFPNPRNAIRKNVIANLVALDRLGEAQVQAATFLFEEKTQGIHYGKAKGQSVLAGLSIVEDRIPFLDKSVRTRWKGHLAQAFGGLVQP